MTTATVDRPTTTPTAPVPPRRRPRPPARYVVVSVLAVLALVGALVGPAVYGFLTDSTAKASISSRENAYLSTHSSAKTPIGLPCS